MLKFASNFDAKKQENTNAEKNDFNKRTGTKWQCTAGKIIPLLSDRS
jgi:hypothetical protein